MSKSAFHALLPVALAFFALISAPGDLRGAGAEIQTFRVTWIEGGQTTTSEVQAYSLPGEDPDHRLIFCPEPGDGFPIAAIARDARGTPRPELAHPRERRLADAFLTWFEVDQLIEAKWRKAGAEGAVTVPVPSLRMRRPLPITHRAEERGTGVRVTLGIAAPIVQDGNMKVELKEMSWVADLDEDAEITRLDLSHSLVRTFGTLEQQVDATLRIELTDREKFPARDAKALGKEFELLAPAARALIGNNPEEIEKARKGIGTYREKYPEGRLSGVVVQLESSLISYAERVAGVVDPDEAAEKLIGSEAPDFTLKDLDGEEVSLSSYRGKTVILSFWGYT